MPYANLEKAREYRRNYARKYRATNKHKNYVNKYKNRRMVLNRRQYVENGDKIRHNAKQYRVEHAIEIKNRLLQLKIEVFNAYGGIFCCKCGESRLATLTLDHIAQDGAKCRKYGDSSDRAGGVALYRKLRSRKFPSGYRVLCSNCNIIAWVEHDIIRSNTKNAIYHRNRTRRIKQEIMTRLGGHCIICGTADIRVLTVHHIDNNGAHHRQVTGGRGGNRFYEHLLKSGEFSGIECRCFSCNDAAEWE